MESRAPSACVCARRWSTSSAAPRPTCIAGCTPSPPPASRAPSSGCSSGCARPRRARGPRAAAAYTYAEPAAVALPQPVPTAHRVLLRTAPGFDRAFGRRLLLVGAAQRYPVPLRLQHLVQVFDRAQLVAELGLADDAYEGRRARGFVLVHLILRRSARRGQLPGRL